MLSPFLFTVVVDAVIELRRQVVLCEWLFADNLVLICETVEGLCINFMKLKEAFVSMGLKVWKPK